MFIRFVWTDGTETANRVDYYWISIRFHPKSEKWRTNPKIVNVSQLAEFEWTFPFFIRWRWFDLVVFICGVTTFDDLRLLSPFQFLDLFKRINSWILVCQSPITIALLQTNQFFNHQLSIIRRFKTDYFHWLSIDRLLFFWCSCFSVSPFANWWLPFIYQLTSWLINNSWAHLQFSLKISIS